MFFLFRSEFFFRTTQELEYLYFLSRKARNFSPLQVKWSFPYWYRLENLDFNFTLLKDAYEESKKLFEIKIPSWYGSIILLIKD